MTTVVTAWHVEEDKFRKRKLGKSLEELSELSCVLARCLIQGVDEVDPSSGKVNRVRMQEEVADVYAQLNLLVLAFKLNEEEISERIVDKINSMKKWEQLIIEEEIANWPKIDFPG